MNVDRKMATFQRLRRSQTEAGLSTSKEVSLICPLCWRHTTFADLSIEHVIPSSVGGSTITLTCRACNNSHGSIFDAHIAKYQMAADAFQGFGTVPGKMQVSGREVAVNTTWGWPKSPTNIAIVGKASNPIACTIIEDEFTTGNPKSLDLTLRPGYIKNRFQTGLLRSAYLALFSIFGYDYTKHDVVQVVRRRIIDPSLSTPDLRTLTGEVQNLSLNLDNDYFVIHGFMDDVPFFQVVIRLKIATESHQFVMMPVPHAKSGQFFDIAAKVARENPKMTLKNIPREAIFTGADPCEGDS